MKKYVLAPALAALAMFLLGFLYWGLPMSPAYKSIRHVADDDAAAQALGRIFPETGIYLVPGIHLEPTRLTELMQRGPTAEVVFVKEGRNPMAASTFLLGYIHYFVLALLLMIMLANATPSFHCFTCRIRFAAAVGLVAAVFEFTDVIWTHHPLGYHLAVALYILLQATVAGLVLARFTMTSTAEPAPAAPRAATPVA